MAAQGSCVAWRNKGALAVSDKLDETTDARQNHRRASIMASAKPMPKAFPP